MQVGDAKDDNVQVVEWLAAQPWCSGSVGMMGLSWGGNNAVFTAARRPAALKAIVAISHTIDSYSHGLTWKGGCLLGANFSWATMLMSYHTRPPDPAVAGEAWRAMWLRRLEGHVPQAQFLIGHQRRDAYWDSRTLDIDALGCPLLDVAGFADPNYANVVFELLARAKVPRQGIVGPWAHIYPQMANPGPAVGFMEEVDRWFARWLKDARPGIEAPMLRAFMREDLPAARQYATAPGRWIAETVWPSPRIATRTLRLSRGALTDEALAPATLSVRSPQSCGLGAGAAWPNFAYADGPELPGDQRGDDAMSLCFDTAPLDARVEILGRPTLRLSFSVDRPVANLAVRLCDVKPAGASARVAFAVVNLPRLSDDRAPTPMQPARVYEIAVPLDATCYAFRPGHRIRLAVSTAYWPMIWPTPEAVTLSVHTGASRLDLPVRPPDAAADAGAGFGPTDAADPLPHRWLRPPRRDHRVERRLNDETSVLTLDEDHGRYRLDEHGLEVESGCREVRSIADDDPLSARADIEWRWSFARADWRASTRVRSTMRATSEAFFIDAELTAQDGETPVFERAWSFRFPRDHL